MEGSRSIENKPLHVLDVDANAGYDTDIVSIKVEPVYLENEKETDKTCDDDMRHVEQTEEEEHGMEQNAERRNETQQMLTSSDQNTLIDSPQLPGREPNRHENALYKDDLTLRSVEGYTTFVSNTDDLSEPSLLDKEVESSSLNDVSLGLISHDSHVNGHEGTLVYDSTNGFYDSGFGRGYVPISHTASPYSLLNYNRVKPVGKGNNGCALLTSSRGYVMLLADNYRYGKERNRGNRHYWRCRVRGCHGRAVTVRDQFHEHTLVSASMHSHPPPDCRMGQSSDSVTSIKMSGPSPHDSYRHSEDDGDKNSRMDDLDKVEDDVFINSVEDDLPVFVDDETPSEPQGFPTKDTTKEEEICKTVLPKRGRLTLIARNFMYGRDRCRNDRHYWRCRIRQCHGRAVTKYDSSGNHVLVACTPHSHSPSDYPESVMSEALESQDKAPSTNASNTTKNRSVEQTKTEISEHIRGKDEQFSLDKDQQSPDQFSDLELNYHGLEDMKESITVVHPKEVSEDHPVISEHLQTSRVMGISNVHTLHGGSRSSLPSNKRVPSSSPEIDDVTNEIQAPKRYQKEKENCFHSMDWHRPRYVSYDIPDYEPWSDHDCPVGDENCMCHATLPRNRAPLHSETDKDQNLGQRHGSPYSKDHPSGCHLVKSHSGVWYLMANRYAHLKDNIQKDKHFWKCHHRHCNGQAITKLCGNSHTLVDFVPHHHPPMGPHAHLKDMGINYELSSLYPDQGYNGSREPPSFLDLNSHSFLPKETDPVEICRHVMSRRGKHILLARGYSFGIERNRNERYYWRCKIRGCRGRAVTKMLGDGNHALLHFANHMHPPLVNQSCDPNCLQDEHGCGPGYKDHVDLDNYSPRDDPEMIDLNNRVPSSNMPGGMYNVITGRQMPYEQVRGNGTRCSVSCHDHLKKIPSPQHPPNTGSVSGKKGPEYIKPGRIGDEHPSSDRFHPEPIPPSQFVDEVFEDESRDLRRNNRHKLWNFGGRYSRSLSPTTIRMDDVDRRCSTESPSFKVDLLSSSQPAVPVARNAHIYSGSSFSTRALKRTSIPNSDQFSSDSIRSKRSRFEFFPTLPSLPPTDVELKLGEKVIEGKTKIVYALPEYKDGNYVLLESKDRITCGDGARADSMEGKAEYSTSTTSSIFELLNQVGIKTHFIQKHTETKFIAYRCEMIPLEFVSRRIATGSFLRRNAGVKEGYRFAPPILETFFKDDANHDPQWSREQCIEAALTYGGVTIGRRELDMMGETAVAVFEILEKAWAYRNCVLVDMKVEFGINPVTKEILLADVIDNDSWRLWPAGDKRLMRDKQVYRNLREVTPQAMEEIKKNYKWVADECKALLCKPSGRVVIFMGSASDKEHAQKIQKFANQYGVPSESRVTSAHKGTEETIKVLRWYESHGVPTVFIAIAGRSNGLGPVLSGNTAYPVINCPPVKADWGTSDIWSSLRLPSGLGCTTVMDPQAAALAAAQIVGMNDHVVWSTMRAQRLTNLVTLMKADGELTSSS